MRFFHNPTLARYTHAIMRIVIGLLFMQHGAQKILGWFGGVDGNGMTPPLMSQFGLAGVLELVGGFLIVIGLFTRIVAFILSGEMAVAYFMAHLPRGVVPILNGGELAALYCFVFLFFAFNGAGPLSVDSAREGRTRTVRA
jgi:putative oxidoreductase